MSDSSNLTEAQKTKVTRLWRKIHATAPARFDRYELDEDQDDLQRLARVGWNIALCEAVTPTMNIAEVSLRNCIHLSMIDATNDENWLLKDDRFKTSEQSLLDKVIEELVSRGLHETCTDSLVADLPFRFWTGLLKPQYESLIWRRLTKYRGINLLEVCPNGHIQVYKTFNDARIIRNRAYHHEPIFDHPNLGHAIADVQEASACISHHYSLTVLSLDRFQRIWHNGNGLERFRAHYSKQLCLTD